MSVHNLSDDQARLMSLFSQHDQISLKGELVRLINGDIRKPIMNDLIIEATVHQLVQLGYIEQVLGDETIPYKITRRGMNIFGDYMVADAKSVIQEVKEKESREIDFKLKMYQLKEKGIMHRKLFGIELFIWIAISGLLLSILSIYLQS